MKANEIRNKWLEYFKSKDHHVVEPASLIPVNDESLLWINSGVATLKPYFEGTKNPPSPRLTNSQKSLRTNDIENVGITARHHTLFEMLGNFSIGDYFKKEAIIFAWEFLTDKKWLGIDPSKLYVTYFKDDKEAKELWIKETNIEPKRIISMGKDTNFWDVGLGPCGPSTEIFFDRGEKYDKRGIEILEKDLENDRYVEIWNIVFSSFNNDGNGNYKSLPRKNIDTGAGLERLACILQDTPTNFETDLFMPIIKEIEKHTSKRYDIESYFGNDKEKTHINKSFKIIADHIRAITFAIADGQEPSNIGRGYIIRRLARRALATANVNLGIKLEGKFLSSLVDVVNDITKDFYSYLGKELKRIKETLNKEEESFITIIEKASDLVLKEKDFNGEKAFTLYETHGIPYDLIESICETNKIKLDKKDFDKRLVAHQELARKNRKEISGMSLQDENINYYDGLSSEFLGYEKEEIKSKVIGLIQNNKPSKTLNKDGIIILDKTPFYATSGGQEHDTGIIKTSSFEFEVSDVTKTANGLFLHKGITKKGSINLDDEVTASIDKDRRKQTKISHSTIHLIFHSLEAHLKQDLPQAGSLCDKDKFRFDFKCNIDLNADEIKKQIINDVTDMIKKDIKQETKVMSLSEAKKMGAKFMEDETYGDKVRVVTFGKDIIDLCGGTHISSAKIIEAITITNLEKKGSGIYRLEGLSTKKNILKWTNEELAKWQNEIDPLIKKYKGLKSPDKTIDKILLDFDKAKKDLNLENAIKLFWALQKELNSFERKVQESQIGDAVKAIDVTKLITLIEGINTAKVEIKNMDLKSLRSIYVSLIDKIDKEILLTYSTIGKETSFVIGVNRKNKDYNLATPLNKLRSKYTIKGGGGPQMIQAVIDKDKFEPLINELIKGAK